MYSTPTKILQDNQRALTNRVPESDKKTQCKEHKLLEFSTNKSNKTEIADHSIKLENLKTQSL